MTSALLATMQMLQVVRSWLISVAPLATPWMMLAVVGLRQYSR